MNIIAVDDEYHALKILERSIREAVPECALSCFRRFDEALRFASGHPVDIAFLDIETRGMNGLVLAAKIKELHGQANIIFVTGYHEYAADAFALHASGYLAKPVSAADIEREMENLRYPQMPVTIGVQIRTFGNFDVLVDREPILFSRSKSKELLAYLVDRGGAGVTAKDLAAVLWEQGPYDRSRQQQLQTYITALRRDLARAGAQHILVRRQNFLAIDKTKVQCDLYRYQEGDPKAVNEYMGEYMTNYSWGEFTAALLEYRQQRQME